MDSRRLGIDGVIQAIKSKISGTIPKPHPSPLLDGRVPRSQEAIEHLMAERVGPWEYLVYGGLLKVNMEKLEPKYQDFTMGYAKRNGRHIDRGELLEFTQSSIGSIGSIVANFNRVLSADIQERAFGAPGEPGDVSRIVHLATRFISVYEDFMDWAADLRGTSTSVGAATEALELLAKWAEQPVEECRRFVTDFVSELDTVGKRLEAGEAVDIKATVTLTLDDSLTDAFTEKLHEAVVRQR